MNTMARDQIKLTEDDYKRKTFKRAPGGIYTLRILKKNSKIKRSGGKSGVVLNLQIIKGPHKGVTMFDEIQTHVGWKIAQLLAALKIKKMKLTVQELFKLVVGKDVRAAIKEERWAGAKKNKVVQYLPPKGASEDAEDESDDDDLDDEEDDATTDDADENDDDEEDADDEETTDDDEDGASDEEEDDDAPEEDDDEETPYNEGDDDDDADGEDEGKDEEEEEAKPKVKSKKKASAKPVPAPTTKKKKSKASR